MPKKVIPLTDIQVKHAKTAPKEVKLFDGGGLFLLITPSGGKLWNFKYRFDNKEKKLAFGAYPVVTLADARQRREDAKKLLANVVDPGAIRKQQKAVEQEQAATFKNIAVEWHTAFKEKWTEKHSERLLTRLEQDFFPFLGDVPIKEIKAPALLELLRRVEIRSLEQAHKLWGTCNQIFSYAIASGRVEFNPAAGLVGTIKPVKHKHMAAPTEPKAVAELLKAIEDFSGSFVVKCALRLAPMLFVRPGELRKAEWSEFNLDDAVWNIPAEKMKMRQPHLVPLSRQTLQVLKELHPLTGNGKYLFPCRRSTLTPMSDNTINASLRRLGFERDEITGHGFRAMARTMLHEILHFTPDAIEAQLAHAVPDRLGRAYNRTQFIAERTKMMQTWADYLDELKSVAKVMPFKRAA
jgi:integrase